MDSMPMKSEPLKKFNRKYMLDILRKEGRTSVSSLAKRTGLSRTTVIKNLNFFREKEYINVIGKGKSTAEGGKRPEIYAFNERAGYICALSIRKEHSFGGVTDLSGRLLLNMRMPHKPNSSIHNVVRNISKMINAAVDALDLSRDRLFGVAIGCDGLIDSAQGLVNRALHFPSWGEDVPIADLVRVALGRGVIVTLESALAQLALGELHEDYSLKDKRVLTLFHGDSVYAGLLEPSQNNSSNVRAVHIGQMRIDRELEYGDLINSAVVMKRAKVAGLNIDSLVHLDRIARRGDEKANKILNEVISFHCSALYNAILMFEPDIVLLQGDYAELGQPFCDLLQKTLRDEILFGYNKTFTIRPSEIDMDRGFLIGAAMTMIEKFFADSSIYED